MNSVILIGRLAKDPELQYTPTTQTAACRLTLAVDRPKHNGDAQGADYVRSADFIRITTWGKQAETCDRYLSKGRQIAVHGRIQTGSYKNKDGATIYTTDVVADRVEFLGNGNHEQAQKKTEFNTGSGEKAYVDPEMLVDYPDSFSAAEEDVPF